MEIIILRMAIALTMVAFGMNQIIEPNYWTDYLPEWFKKILPVSDNAFMLLHALGNVILGAIFALGLFQITVSYIVLIWWIILFPFVFIYNWRIALRDLAIIASLYLYINLL